MSHPDLSFLPCQTDDWSVRYPGELVEAHFIQRENRFAALVDLDGECERVHVPNSGRMRELLLPGATVLLHGADAEGRKTRYDLVVVETSNVLVSVDSRVPNKLLAEAMEDGAIPKLAAYTKVRPEHTWGDSRFDFLASGNGHQALVEVKGCTLVREDGLALFPDAPTSRGARHVRELARARGEGLDACVVFMVQRSDGRVFAPNDMTDRTFGDALRAAHSGGVRVLAYGTRVTRSGVELADPIEVDLGAALEEVS